MFISAIRMAVTKTGRTDKARLKPDNNLQQIKHNVLNKVRDPQSINIRWTGHIKTGVREHRTIIDLSSNCNEEAIQTGPIEEQQEVAEAEAEEQEVVVAKDDNSTLPRACET